CRGNKRTGGADAVLLESCLFGNPCKSRRKGCVSRAKRPWEDLLLQFRNRGERERNAYRAARNGPRKCRFVRRRFSRQNGGFDLGDISRKISHARPSERSRPHRSEVRRYRKRPRGAG